MNYNTFRWIASGQSYAMGPSRANPLTGEIIDADIIDGHTKSPVGALGIAQFMPATAQQLGINPLDPFQAIDGAGRYLASLYRQTSSWSQALAAYNWGIGNVTRRGLDSAPTETRNYFTQILADVNNASGTTYA